MRINQYIAHAGVCARRAAEQLVSNGKIAVNGKIMQDLTYRVKPTDVVSYQGKVLAHEQKCYVLLHKPLKYMTTLHDPQGRAVVTDLLQDKRINRVYPVGRLDYMTSGLLLLTNDGALATKLMHPSKGVPKTYRATLDADLQQAHVEQLRKGLTLLDGPVTIDAIQRLKGNPRHVELTIHVGRNRIVRRLFQHLGYRVMQLTRIRYAHLTLQGVPKGSWRFLTKSEIQALKQLTA